MVYGQKDYYLFAEVDSPQRGSSQVKESNENNNLSRQFVSIDSKNRLPDLTIEFKDVEIPSVFPDPQGTIELIVKNQGTKAIVSKDVPISLFASTDKILDPTTNQPAPNPVFGKPSYDELLGTFTTSLSLKPGESKTLTIDLQKYGLRAPSVVAPGAYYLFAEVDSPQGGGSRVRESNENNNLSSSEFVSASGSNEVVVWNATFLNAIKTIATRPITNGPFVARNAAILHTAIYDAVNALDRSHNPYYVNIDAKDQRLVNASPEAAVAGAAHRVLVSLYPQETKAFDEQFRRSLAAIPNGEAENKGVALGEFVADQILALRANDGSANADVPYIPGTEPGSWRPTPSNFIPALLPNWGKVKPFAIPSGSAFRPPGPPEFGSPQYAAELEEVRQLGAKNNTEVTTVTRTPDQTEIAAFWSYDTLNSFGPPGQLLQIAEIESVRRGNTLVEDARLFGRLGVALADAGIATWDAKYTFNQLRPVTAIRQEAEADFVPGAVGDSQWEPLIETPPFGDYPSGHAVGTAATTILADFFGQNHSFTIPSAELGGVARSYSSFAQAADELGLSRIYAGLHVRSSFEAGQALGIEVGNYVLENVLL
ncbi:MAG: CARDB domain-containing protein [Nostoc sp.]|uniref:CARDB domain-containing protein n=1 Tax=Nostoc sp. TaxID=1180 RepID=UPI002FFD3F87